MISSKEKKLSAVVISALILATFLTSYLGSTDIGDYSDIARYLAGNYQANLRSSHSYFFGAVHSPLINLFQAYNAFKFTSLIFLILIVYSVYLLSEKSSRAFWLMLLSPIVWYMAPWINSIQVSSLLFLWGFYFIKKFDISSKKINLLYSGILIGLSWAFWDAVLFFSFFLAISFLYNKKTYNFALFYLFVLIGLLPKLLLDNYLLGFYFSGILRYFSGVLTAILYGGISGTMSPSSKIYWIILLLFVPFFSYNLLSRGYLRENKKTAIFLALSILLLLKNSQIRYLLILIPIIFLETHSRISGKEFKIQIIYSIIISLIVLAPYAIQINHSTNAEEFSSLVLNIKSLDISDSQSSLLLQDIESISADYPSSSFVVGNKDDDYQKLAHLYWGKDVKEFVSIQDYNLFLENKTAIFEKTFMPVPRIQDRRQIFISGGIRKNENDGTDYSSIALGIGVGEPINLENFSIVKRYNLLYLSKTS